jgi:hypothetical protein
MTDQLKQQWNILLSTSGEVREWRGQKLMGKI